MDKKRMIILGLAIAVIIGLVLVFAPPLKKDKSMEGTVMDRCPNHVYKVGDIWKATAKLLPNEDCTYTDEYGCDVHVFNSGTKVLYPSMRAEVIEVKVSGNAQYMRVGDMLRDKSETQP